jgi:septal ring factor EnvC (AmiA/AmiB activator)
VFPLVAKTDLWDNYGDPRPNGRHAGIDMENPWRAPVVAVEDGSIKYWDSGLGGCMLYLYGRSGTTYMYIHLNNDLTAKNDNKGACGKGVSFTVPNGAKVTAGQQIAWNGDSGDANGNPHLHFEVHPNDGADVDPFRYLKRAAKPLFAAPSGRSLQPRAARTARRRRRRSGDARGRPRPPVPGRPLARHRHADDRAHRAPWAPSPVSSAS